MNLEVNSINSSFNSVGYTNLCRPNFRAETSEKAGFLSAPIETVNKVIEVPLDTFVKQPTDEKSKKERKRTITVASSIIVLSGLVAIFNPKYSSKMLDKMKKVYAKSAENLQKNKNSKYYKFMTKFYEKTMQALEFTNNFNSAKDVAFKWLCLDEKKFLGVQNKTLRNCLQNVDKGFRFVMKKPYNAITNWFDKIGKATVYRKYKNVNSRLDKLNDLIMKNKDKLNSSEKAEIERILEELNSSRNYFDEQNISKRLLQQEHSMAALERDFLRQYRTYKKGFTSIGTDKSEHFNRNFSFWAQEIMMPTRNKLEKSGNSVVEKFFGNEHVKSGYSKIYDILSPHLDDNAKSVFRKAEKTLRKANHIECVEYFDKKRDLVLGGAPTDILTAVLGLGMSGISLGAADNKDERISSLMTSVFPVIAGFGTSLALTGMLFSGIKGIAIGGLTGLGFNYIGQKVDDARLAHKQSLNSLTEKPNKNKEAING